MNNGYTACIPEYGNKVLGVREDRYIDPWPCNKLWLLCHRTFFLLLLGCCRCGGGGWGCWGGFGFINIFLTARLPSLSLLFVFLDVDVGEFCPIFSVGFATFKKGVHSGIDFGHVLCWRVKINKYIIYRLKIYFCEWIMTKYRHWDFDASSAQTTRVSALTRIKMEASASALFCRNSWA